MLRRAAVRGCGGSASFVGKRALSSATPAAAPTAAVPLRLLQRHAHSTAGAAACGIQQRTRGRDGTLGYCTLPLHQRGSLSPSLLGPGQQQQQQRGGGEQNFSWARLPPHAQWRALLSTAPPSKEDDKAAAAAASSSASSATPDASGSGTPAPPEGEEEVPKKKKPTWKDMLKKHGPIFLVYWNGMWIISGLTIYAGLTLGEIDPLPLAYAINLDRLIDLSRLDPAHGNVAAAIVLNEVAELVRFPLVVATVPAVTRWWEGARPEFMKSKLGADGKPKPTLTDQIRRHGPTFMVWWGTLWVAGAAGLFGAFEYELFGAGVDALSLARSVNIDQFINLDAIPPSWGNLGVAIAFNEALEIVRFPLAVATVPYITRLWERRKGGPGPGA